MESSAKSVLVTGAGGFIGRHVAMRFAKHGWRVYALVHRQVPEELERHGMTVIRGDITDGRTVNEVRRIVGGSPGVVVHVAGLASDLGGDKLHAKLNFEPIPVYAALAARKFIYISSMDVYGIKDFNGEDEETLPIEPKPRNPYPKYKIKSERWIKEFMRADQYVILRPGAVYGDGDKTIGPRMVEFLASSPWIVHFGKWKGSNRWPAADVRTLAEVAYVAACSSSFDGLAINIIDKEHVSLDGYYRRVGAVHFPEKRFKSITLPFFAGWLIGWFSTLLSNALGRTQALFDPTAYSLLHISSNLDVSSRRQEEALSEYERMGSPEETAE